MPPITRRDLITAAPVGLALGSYLTSPGIARSTGLPADLNQKDSSAIPWYKRTLVGIEVGPSETDAIDPTYYSKVSGKSIVHNLRVANVEYAVIFMKDPYFAYYNSRIVRKCPSLGERDLLREILDEAGKYKLPIVAYVVIQGDISTWLVHPEWRMEDSAGDSIRSRLCFNSAYLEYTKQVAFELMQYDIAGFHFDMLDFGFSAPYGCFCERNCRPLFKKQFGEDMPRFHKPTWDENWDNFLTFRANSNARFSRELATFVHSKRSDVSVDFNYHGQPPFSWVEGELPVKHAINGDFVTAEGLPWRFGYNNVSLLPTFLFGARADGAVQVASSRSMYGYYDPTVRPINDMKWEIATYHAHGAQVTIVDKINYDGTQDPVVYERLGEVFGASLQKRDYYRHKQLCEVGLYYSARSRDWFGQEETIRYQRAVYGAQWALTQSHITMGMVMDETLSLDRLREFTTIYVPNAAILTKREVDAFVQYVSLGGKVLITGLSGLYDHYGHPQPVSSIETLIGAKFTRLIDSEDDNFLRLPAALANGDDAIIIKDIPTDWPMSVWGPLTVYRPTTSRAFGDVLVRYRANVDRRWAGRLSAGRVVGSAIFINRHGKGAVVYAACCPDAAWASDYRMLEHRYLLRNLLRYLNPNPLLSVHAPANVEVVASQDNNKNRLLIRLVAFSAPASLLAAPFDKGRRVLPPPMEEPLHYQAHIKVNRHFLEVSTGSGNTHVARTGNEVHVQTSEIDEVLVFTL